MDVSVLLGEAGWVEGSLLMILETYVSLSVDVR